MTEFTAYSFLVFFIIILVFGNCSTKQLLIILVYLDFLLISIAQETGFIETIWMLLYTVTLAFVFIIGMYFDKTRKRLYSFSEPIIKKHEVKDVMQLFSKKERRKDNN